MRMRFHGISTDWRKNIWRGGPDANGQPPILRIAEGQMNPCRHCLGLICERDQNLILARRPFIALQHYAETGPIFLHAKQYKRFEQEQAPIWFGHLEPAILRGYDENHWIHYDTGTVVRGPDIANACAKILADPSVIYVRVRSKFNCFQCRVERRSASATHQSDSSC